MILGRWVYIYGIQDEYLRIVGRHHKEHTQRVKWRERCVHLDFKIFMSIFKVDDSPAVRVRWYSSPLPLQALQRVLVDNSPPGTGNLLALCELPPLPSPFQPLHIIGHKIPISYTFWNLYRSTFPYVYGLSMALVVLFNPLLFSLFPSLRSVP